MHAYAVRVRFPIIYLHCLHLEDREYLKRELARIYSPHTREVKSAMKRLREDINGCPELVEALKQTRWNRNRNAYTARQVRLIAEYLCID